MNRIAEWFLSLLFILLSLSGYTQIKFEREYRLKDELVPPKARSFIDSCNFTSKIKWYGEESFTGSSVEAKVNHNSHLHSIEFDTVGNIQDVEIRVKWSEIKEPVRNIMMGALDSLYTRQKFKEIQIQWTGQRDDLIRSVVDGKAAPNITIKYEIVVKANRGKGMEWFEILFSAEGKVEQISIITFQNSDNLEY